MDTTVEMSPATLAALKKRGGTLFIWLDGAGMIHVRTHEPRAMVTFEPIRGEDYVLHVDSEIKPPKRWVIVYKRLPWPHFDALHDPPESTSPSLADVITDQSWPWP